MNNEIDTKDFVIWCNEEKGIPNIMSAPFDTWLECIHEYCELYYKDYYGITLNKLAGTNQWKN